MGTSAEQIVTILAPADASRLAEVGDPTTNHIPVDHVQDPDPTVPGRRGKAEAVSAEAYSVDGCSCDGGADLPTEDRIRRRVAVYRDSAPFVGMPAGWGGHGRVRPSPIVEVDLPVFVSHGEMGRRGSRLGLPSTRRYRAAANGATSVQLLVRGSHVSHRGAVFQHDLPVGESKHD